MDQFMKDIFSISTGIRYTAVYSDGNLVSAERPEIQHTSSSESDKYEELIVNPVLLKLVIQRGNIDCGGAEYILIRYGNFFEFVKPLANGHISIGIQPDADPLALIAAIEETIDHHHLK